MKNLFKIALTIMLGLVLGSSHATASGACDKHFLKKGDLFTINVNNYKDPIRKLEYIVFQGPESDIGIGFQNVVVRSVKPNSKGNFINIRVECTGRTLLATALSETSADNKLIHRFAKNTWYFKWNKFHWSDRQLDAKRDYILDRWVHLKKIELVAESGEGGE